MHLTDVRFGWVVEYCESNSSDRRDVLPAMHQLLRSIYGIHTHMSDEEKILLGQASWGPVPLESCRILQDHFIWHLLTHIVRHIHNTLRLVRSWH